VSSLDQDADPSVPATKEVPVPEFAEADPNGCDPTAVDPNGCDPAEVDPNGCTVHVVDEDDEEEDEIPLIRKNSRRYIASGESSGVPSPALSALIGLQELSLMNFDQTLEDMVPEDLLSKPADGGVMDVCADVPHAGLGSSRAASRASSTLERGLEGQEAGLDCTAPTEVTEGPSALEVAVAENSTLKDGAGAYPTPEGVAGDDSAWMGSASCDLAPEGVRVGSPSHTSMDVHVGSSPPHSGCMAIAQALGQGVTLEASAPDDTELVPTDSLRVVSVGDPSSSHQLTSHSSPTSRYFGFFWSDFTPCR
jgi:DNA-binding transcriptional regulator YdaS (Cro superfamily)